MRGTMAASHWTSRRMTIGTISSGVTKALGFRAAGVSAGIKRHTGTVRAAARSGAHRLGHPGDRRGRVHHQPRAGRPGHRVARSPGAFGRNGAGDHRQQRLRECLHRRRRACRSRSTWPARRPACSAASPKKCWSPRPASSACRCRSRRSDAGFRRRDRGARSGPGRRGGARHHDDRSVPEGGGGAHGRPGQRDRDRRHGQRLGHDRADDGDDAGVRDDGCGGATDAAGSRAARGGRRHVQRHHRGRRVFDQRLRDDPRQRRVGRHDRRRGELLSVRRRAQPASAASWRSASFEAAKARPSS